jgi:hypothetical protein
VAEKPYVEPPKQKAQDPFDLDGDNAEKENQEENKELENADGQGDDAQPKFKPENFAWTNYDGIPRNFIQILIRLKKLPFLQVFCRRDDVYSTLLSEIKTHIINSEDKSNKGMITLYKIEN